ncbi:MAG: hypothetical protein P8075_12525 [Deltaproteobacteria bacterium]
MIGTVEIVVIARDFLGGFVEERWDWGYLATTYALTARYHLGYYSYTSGFTEVIINSR